ncbi:hypothetical protein DC487_14050 [Sphingobacterium corticibacter]|uniref:Uncharacterized protein n=1 Tax=Sphingobacterium corticibacter TaxID=2171749 RepID=A0A2T8HGV7_9SPHI|nr:hypothetical protein DC487_14050 [Sphingobacterium corticibacter]
MQNIYKIFYVAFSNFHTRKELPWFNATLLLTSCSASFTLGLLAVTGLFHSVRSIFTFPTMPEKLSTLFFVITLCGMYWFIYYYILFTKLKISKSDGSCPYYKFNPTRREKILTWAFLIILGCSSLILIGIDMIFIQFLSLNTMYHYLPLYISIFSKQGYV